MKRTEWLSIAAFALSILSFVTGYWQSQHTQVASVRPVLVFEYAGAPGWIVRNVGSGPALDVTVWHMAGSGAWESPIRIPPVAAGASFTPGWLGRANLRGLGLSYADVDARHYSSTTMNDLTRLRRGDIFPRVKEAAVGKYWNQPPSSYGE